MAGAALISLSQSLSSLSLGFRISALARESRLFNVAFWACMLIGFAMNVLAYSCESCARFAALQQLDPSSTPNPAIWYRFRHDTWVPYSWQPFIFHQEQPMPSA